MEKSISKCRDGKKAAEFYRDLFVARMTQEEIIEVNVGIDDLVDAFTLGFNMGLSNRMAPNIRSSENVKRVIRLVEKDVKEDRAAFFAEDFSKHGDTDLIEAFLRESEFFPSEIEGANFEQPVGARVFYGNYKKYCKGLGILPESLVKFGYFLKKVGFEKKRTTYGWRYKIFFPKDGSMVNLRNFLCYEG